MADRTEVGRVGSRSAGSMWAVLMALAAGAALVASLLFRDQLPVARSLGRAGGLGILLAGAGLFLWAVLHLEGGIAGGVAPRLDRLVVSGPYRFVRHPVYLALTVELIGASVVTRSLAGLVVTALVFLPAALHRACLEERALREAFGDTWQEYHDRTGFFLPRLRPRRPGP